MFPHNKTANVKLKKEWLLGLNIIKVWCLYFYCKCSSILCFHFSRCAHFSSSNELWEEQSHKSIKVLFTCVLVFPSCPLYVNGRRLCWHPFSLFFPLIVLRFTVLALLIAFISMCCYYSWKYLRKAILMNPIKM